MLCAHWEKRRGAVLELQEQLQQIPAFLSDLETITSRIGETFTVITHKNLNQWSYSYRDLLDIFNIVTEGGC